MRPRIDIVIPVEGTSAQLDRTVALVEKHTINYNLHVLIEPDLNVCEARQRAMDEVVRGRYMCILDYDSEMIDDRWLDTLYLGCQRDGIVASFLGEWWGTDEPHDCMGSRKSGIVASGPAACMFLDTERIPSDVKWNPHIGLRNGWLGGDMDEREYCVNLWLKGLKFWKEPDVMFHHTGGRKTMTDFTDTDRCKTATVMMELINIKANVAPDDMGWFKDIKYVRSRQHDHNTFAPGANLRQCYHDIIRRHGLTKHEPFVRAGIV